MAINWAAAHEAYRRDGAVRLPGLLNREQLDAALKAWEWSLANPTPVNAKALPNAPDMATRLKPGETVRAPGFLQLYPKAGGSEATDLGSRPAQKLRASSQGIP